MDANDGLKIHQNDDGTFQSRMGQRRSQMEFSKWDDIQRNPFAIIEEAMKNDTNV